MWCPLCRRTVLLSQFSEIQTSGVVAADVGALDTTMANTEADDSIHQRINLPAVTEEHAPPPSTPAMQRRSTLSNTSPNTSARWATRVASTPVGRIMRNNHHKKINKIFPPRSHQGWEKMHPNCPRRRKPKSRWRPRPWIDLDLALLLRVIVTFSLV